MKKPTKKPTKKALAVRARSPLQGMMHTAMQALALPTPRIDPNYQIAMFRREHIMWQLFKQKDGTSVAKPFALHAGLVDVLNQRGYTELSTRLLPARPCMETGCRGYLDLRKGDRETDYQQVAEATVKIKNHDWKKTGETTTVTMSATACRHNSGMKGTRYTELAETRAISRAISRAINAGVCTVIELSDLDKGAVVKIGDRILSKAEMGNVIEAEFAVAKGEAKTGAEVAAQKALPAPVVAVGQAPQDAGGDARTVPARPSGATATIPSPEPAADGPGDNDKWKAANGALHARAAEMKLPTDVLHAYIYHVSSGALGKQIASLSDLTADELYRWLGTLRKMKPSNVAWIMGWFEHGEDGGVSGADILEAARAAVAVRQGKKS
jgi:hypothetical protein